MLTTIQIDTMYYKAHRIALEAFDSGNQVKGWAYIQIANRLLTAKLNRL